MLWLERVVPWLVGTGQTGRRAELHLLPVQVLDMMREYEGDAAPEGAELEAFLSAPKHSLARLIRDLFADEAAATTMEVPPCLHPPVHPACSSATS